MVLGATIKEFNYEEQAAIYLYYAQDTPLYQISTITHLPYAHIKSTVVLYSMRLSSKLSIFKKAVEYDRAQQVSIGEMLETNITDWCEDYGHV